VGDEDHVGLDVRERVPKALAADGDPPVGGNFDADV
jgi:hypothetical protein